MKMILKASFGDLPKLGFAGHVNSIRWEAFCVLIGVWLSALTNTSVGRRRCNVVCNKPAILLLLLSTFLSGKMNQGES